MGNLFQLDVVLESNLSTIRVLEAIQKKLQRYVVLTCACGEFFILLNVGCTGVVKQSSFQLDDATCFVQYILCAFMELHTCSLTLLTCCT